MFRYVDLFSDTGIVDVSRFQQTTEFCGLKTRAISFESTLTLAARESRGQARIEPTGGGVQTTFELTTHADDFELDDWFEAAHHEHKKYLWHTLTEQFRETSGLFDDHERMEFGHGR